MRPSASEVRSLYAVVIHDGDFGCDATGIGEPEGFIGGVFECPGDPQTSHPLLGIVEDRPFIEGRKGRNAVDDPQVGLGLEDEPGVFQEQRFSARFHPVHGHREVVTLGHKDFPVFDGPHMRSIAGGGVASE